jgi:flagellar hook-basal body complex protein FliE
MIDQISPLGSAPTAGPQSIPGTELAGRAANVGGNTDAGVDFGAMLSQMASSAANVVRQAETTSIAGIQGTATVQQVVESVMSAEQTLQGAVAIRDKVVAAYLELSRMQI